MNKRTLLLLSMSSMLSMSSVMFSGCPRTAPDATPATEAQDAHEHDHEEAAMKGGVPIPAEVRENMGITFATVESRAISATRRVPGQFELLPTARHEYRAQMSGRATLHVQQFQQVAEGDLLLSIDSPQWRQLQHEAVEAEGDITMAEAALEVARAQRQEAQASLARQEARVASLAEVNVRRADLEADAALARNSLPRLDAEIRSAEAALKEAREHYASRLNTLASVKGIPVEQLEARVDGEAAWRSMQAIELRALADGAVEEIAVNKGGWLETGELGLTTVDPTAVRFHAEAPQADLLLFSDGQPATIVPAQGGSVELQAAMQGTLTVGLTAHEEDRTISLLVTPDSLLPWAKAGVSGYLEVAAGQETKPVLAIPLAALVQDGLEQVIFRRDPKDPDRALRIQADVGQNDGRWVEVKSGLKEGDEVVLEGAYTLKLSGSAQQAPAGYHYHADGQLHKNH